MTTLVLLGNSGGGANIDIITSFDVIEHVEDPQMFIDDAYALLSDGGQMILGTPTDAPIMRELLGEIYEKQILYSTQHLWILSADALVMMAEKAGFHDVKVKYYQRYGVENMLGWLRDKKPGSNLKLRCGGGQLDAAWRACCESSGMADYVILEVRK